MDRFFKFQTKQKEVLGVLLIEDAKEERCKQLLAKPNWFEISEEEYNQYKEEVK